MAKFNPYTWWKRGVTVNPLLKKKPKGSTEPLIWHQILNGDFKESPYWKMANQELVYWKKEVEDYKAKNPRITDRSVQDFANLRWKVYHKRIEKLKEEHLKYETNRISLLKEGLIKAFDIDIWEEMVEKCDGDETKLYNEYKIETIKRKNL
jgi:hypothetical protein